MRGLLLGIALSVLVPGAAWADGCDALTAAMVKEARTPHRYMFTYSSSSGMVMAQSTQIVTGGKFYIRFEAPMPMPWVVNDWTPDTGEAKYRAEAAKTVITCSPGGSDTLNGEAMDVIVSQDAKNTYRTWISKATGLPVKQEDHGNSGGEGIATYEYTNLAAPESGTP